MAYGISELDMHTEGFQHGDKIIIQCDGLEMSVNICNIFHSSDRVKSACDNGLVRS